MLHRELHHAIIVGPYHQSAECVLRCNQKEKKYSSSKNKEGRTKGQTRARKKDSHQSMAAESSAVFPCSACTAQATEAWAPWVMAILPTYILMYLWGQCNYIYSKGDGHYIRNELISCTESKPDPHTNPSMAKSKRSSGWGTNNCNIYQDSVLTSINKSNDKHTISKGSQSESDWSQDLKQRQPGHQSHSKVRDEEKCVCVLYKVFRLGML